ncbi:MAG: GTPase Era [Halorhodospira sp.]
MAEVGEDVVQGERSGGAASIGALTHCGLCALVGRPNVGKSTLLNALIGEKVSIVTRKPQTTRHRILGVLNRPETQVVMVDTPGLHEPGKRALNQQLNRSAVGALEDVDVVVLVVRGTEWKEADARVLDHLEYVQAPVVLAVSQVDRIRDKRQLLPHIERLSGLHEFAAVVPVSAVRSENLEALEQEVIARLPSAPPLFPADQMTDRDLGFRLGELVREQLMLNLGEELPYTTSVQLEQLSREGGVTRVAAVIWVETEGQKPIVIGRGGERLKKIGRSARLQMEHLLGESVHLELWAKVKEGWTDDRRALREFGYTD